MNQNYSDKIKLWWRNNFPYTGLDTIQELTGGQSHPCFLLNNTLVLKIYVSKYHWTSHSKSTGFNVAKEFQTKMELSGYTPKILQIYQNNKDLNADAILMEFVDGDNLSNILYTYTEKVMFENGILVGKSLRDINQTEVLKNQEYNTQDLVDEINLEFTEAKNKGLLYKEIEEFYNSFVCNYMPRIIVEDYVLVHGDIHPENLIITKDGIKLIDFDTCFRGLGIHEMRIILHSACIPADLVPKETEKFYPTGLLIPWLKGIFSSYPELLPAKYIDEIKLIAFLEILGKFNLSDNIGDKDTPRSRGMEMFKLVFEELLIANLFDEHNNTLLK